MPIPWKTAAGIQAVSPDTRLYAERMVFLEGEIHAESAREFVKAILLLNQESRDAIHVFIHSPGGEVKAGLLVYDALQGSPAPCKLYCVGEAHSMAAILFASGRHGRYLLPHSEMLLHEPLLGSHITGNASSIQSISENLLAVKQQITQLLVQHTGRGPKEIEQVLAQEKTFTAQEAVAFGLADQIISFDLLGRM